MYKDPEEPASNEQIQNHLPPIPGRKGGKPPSSKFLELGRGLGSNGGVRRVSQAARLYLNCSAVFNGRNS